MTLTWTFLGSGHSGDSFPQDVPAKMIRDVRDIAAQKGGRVGSLKVVLRLHNGSCCGASYEIENLTTGLAGATVFLCWGQHGCEHWWHAAVNRQRENAEEPGSNSMETPPKVPWMAIAEFPEEPRLTAKQIDLELATAWALVSLYGAETYPEVSAVQRYLA